MLHWGQLIPMKSKDHRHMNVNFKKRTDLEIKFLSSFPSYSHWKKKQKQEHKALIPVKMFPSSFNYSAFISINNPLLFFPLQWELLQFSNTAQVNFSVGFTQTGGDCMLTKLQLFISSSLISTRAHFSVLLQFKRTIVMYNTSRIRVSFYKLSAGSPCSVSFLEKTLERWWNHKMEKAWTLNLCVNKKMPPKHSIKSRR